EGERIIPAADNRELMQMLARGADRDNTIRLLQQEIRELRLMMERKLDGVERNTGDTARTNREMVEQRQIVQVEGPVATVLVEDRTAFWTYYSQPKSRQQCWCARRRRCARQGKRNG